MRPPVEVVAKVPATVPPAPTERIPEEFEGMRYRIDELPKGGVSKREVYETLVRAIRYAFADRVEGHMALAQ
jgi:hypothetical protein